MNSLELVRCIDKINELYMTVNQQMDSIRREINYLNPSYQNLSSVQQNLTSIGIFFGIVCTSHFLH